MAGRDQQGVSSLNKAGRDREGVSPGGTPIQLSVTANIMAEQHEIEEDCVRVFKSGNKHEAEQLLPRTRAAVVRTTFTLFWETVGLVSLLHLAAYRGWLDVVSVLLTVYKCDANWEDDYGRTPLHYAAYNGHPEVVTYFITKQCCHPMTTDNDGWTPLHYACGNGQLNITQYLISELQCDPSTVNNDGITPLHNACSQGHTHIVQYLLSTGKVNPWAEDKDGLSPVDYASRSENILKLFHSFEQCKKDFPVHTFTEDKDQQILRLKEELKAKQMRKTSLSDQFEQREKEMLEQKAVQVTGNESEQKLQAELETVKCMSQAKDQQISMLEQQLQKRKTVQVPSKEKEQQLQAELNAVWRISRAKDQQISMLEQELQKRKTLHTPSVEDTGVQADYLAIAPGSLGEVEVCGETVLEVVGDRSQKLEWPGYGFYIEVPNGALPPSVTASVAVKAILAGQFLLPEDSQLISAIYWISSSEVFLKEVAVNIQHCAVNKSDEERSSFRFIIAKCSQKELPYRFRVREGVFDPHTQYATIMLKQFSLIGATARRGTRHRYIAFKFYKQIPSTVNVEFIFTIVRNLEVVLKYVKEHYRHWKPEPSQTVCFKDVAISLDLPDSPPTVVDGWRIVPMTPPQITKKDVDQFKPKLEIPYCSLHLQWTGGREVNELSHRVTLKGTESPNDFFYICYYPPGGRGQAGAPSGGEASPTIAPLAQGGAATQPPTYHGDPSRTLTTHDLSEVVEAVRDFVDWKSLGLQLGLLHSTLETIYQQQYHNIHHCKMDMLSAWLRQKDNVPQKGVPSWSVLRAALKRMGENALADRIMKEKEEEERRPSRKCVIM